LIFIETQKNKLVMGSGNVEVDERKFNKKVTTYAIDIGSGIFAASCVAPGIKIVDQGNFFTQENLCTLSF
jgi:hypothetical protein